MPTVTLVDTTSTQTLTGKTLTSPVINGGTAGADPVTDLGIATKQYVDDGRFSTGDIKLTLKTTADSGWVLMNDGSIGSSASSATTRASDDTEDLFTLIWTNITDTWAPVSTGRGGSASADFAANKTITLPKTLGRALAGYGVGTVVASGTDSDVDIGAANSFTVPSNNNKWVTGMLVTFSLASGTITGLTSGNPYYIIRSSATLVSLASTLALAQAGTAIDITAKSSPVWSLTHTYTTRSLGEAVGEESHAMSSTELYSHTHTINNAANLKNQAAGVDFANGAGTALNTVTPTNASTGGNAAMNNLQPTAFLNVMVKL